MRMRIFLLSLMTLAGCGGGSSSGDKCDPTVYPDSCPTGLGCDAVLKKCETLASCQSSEDCGGFTCNTSDLCLRNCQGATGADDSRCEAGYLCDAKALTCTRVTSCDPSAGVGGCNGLLCDPATSMCILGADCATDDDCGNYACDPVGGCYTSCEDLSQCGINYDCDFNNHCN